MVRVPLEGKRHAITSKSFKKSRAVGYMMPKREGCIVSEEIDIYRVRRVVSVPASWRSQRVTAANRFDSNLISWVFQFGRSAVKRGDRFGLIPWNFVGLLAGSITIRAH